jgi:DNA repair exonuclease SbcCD ATPase subunit
MNSNEPIILKNDNKTIRYIYHIADIHIKDSNTYNDEYSQVFNKFYNVLYNDPYKQNSIIVICGDIMHNKSLFTNYSLEMFFQFMETLSKIMDVIVIFGNHDGSVLQKRDGIYPLLSRISNVYYLSLSGEYVYNNIVFGVSSLLDGKIFKHSEIKSIDKISIGLYHGIITGSIINGDVLNGIEKQIFTGYDYVLLGEVHDHQYITKTMAYPSSMIQQNFNENLEYHGFIKWDILGKTSQFISIHNDFASIKLYIENGIISNIPKYNILQPKIKIISKNTAKNKCIEILKMLYPNYSSLYIEHRDSVCDDAITEFIDNKLHDLNYQIELIKAFCNKHLKIQDSELINEIVKYHSTISEQIKHTGNNCGKWKLLNLKFSNLFSYGENNEIDFENLSSTVCIKGHNHIGKSALIDIILYSIYGKCSRGKNTEIINTSSTNMLCIVTLELDSIIYKITRIYDNDSGGRSNINLYFTKIDNGKYIDISEQTKTETEKKIIEYFGEYENIIDTNFYLQRESHFVFQTDAKQINILSEHCGIQVFDTMRKLSLADKNSLNEKIKIIRKDANITNSESNTNDIIKQNKINEEVISLKNELLSLDKLIDKFYQNKKNITTDEINEIIDELNDQLGTKISKMHINEILTMIKKVKHELNKQIQQLEFQYKDNNIENISNEIQIYEKELNNKSLLQGKNDIEIEIKSINSMLGIIGNLAHIKCTVCNVGKELSKYYSHYNTVKKNKLDIYNKYGNQNIVSEKALTNKIFELKNQLYKKKDDMTILKHQITELKIKHANIDSNYKTLINYIENIKDDQKIDQEINKIKSDKLKIEEKLDILKEELIISKIQTSGVLKANDNKSKLNILSALDKQYKVIELYTQIMSKNGLFILILKPFMKLLEDKINDILSSVTNFNIKIRKKCLKYNKKNNDISSVDIYIIHNKDLQIGIQNASGAEIFIVTFAFKLSLLELSKCTKSNFFVVDEAFSCLDDYYMNDSLMKMMEILESKNKFSLIIDHHEKVKLACKEEMYIVKDNKEFSCIHNINGDAKNIIEKEIINDLDKIMPMQIKECSISEIDFINKDEIIELNNSIQNKCDECINKIIVPFNKKSAFKTKSNIKVKT